MLKDCNNCSKDDCSVRCKDKHLLVCTINPSHPQGNIYVNVPLPPAISMDFPSFVKYMGVSKNRDTGIPQNGW